MAGEKEIACCVRGYHVYEDMWAAAIREVLVCCCWCVVVGKIFVVKLYSRKIFSYIFCVRKYFTMKKVNYGNKKLLNELSIIIWQHTLVTLMVIPMKSFCQKLISSEIEHFTCCHIHVYIMLYVDVFLTPTSLASIVFQVKIVVKSGIQLV